MHPEGIVEWGTTPKDFFEKKVAMMWTTTGNLTNVKTNAKFDFGVAMLPAQQAARQPDRRRQLLHLQEVDAGAAGSGVEVHQVDDVAERAAQWGIDTGYVAVRPDAWDTPAMKKYVAEFPAGGGRARPAAVSRWRSCRRTTTSASPRR